ncbi:unnamed protein product [Allacma fusca]|uniref:C2H2-type domain-containing protein n=1 Tax=Allacma fusca TaxID=39272 RepID=A0A8J2Q683_9HEXA|nr:unnamed protein product [Allacma fusca]
MSETTRPTLCLICYQRFQGYDLETQALVAHLLTDSFQVFSKYMKWNHTFDFDFRKVAFPFCKACKILVIKINELNQAIEESIEQINQIALSVSTKILSTSDLEKIDKLESEDVSLGERLQSRRIQHYRRQIKHRYAVSVKLANDPLVTAALIRKPASINISGIGSSQVEAPVVERRERKTRFSGAKPVIKRQSEREVTLNKKARTENKAEKVSSETRENGILIKRPRGRPRQKRNHNTNTKDETINVTPGVEKLIISDVEADRNRNHCGSNHLCSSVQEMDAEKTEILPESVTESPGSSQKRNTPKRRNSKNMKKRVPKSKPLPMQLNWEETVLKNLSVGKGLLEMLRQSTVQEILIDDDDCDKTWGGENQNENDKPDQTSDLVHGSKHSDFESDDESQRKHSNFTFGDDPTATTSSESDEDESDFTSKYVATKSPLPAEFNSKDFVFTESTSQDDSTKQPEQTELNRYNSICEDLILECVAKQVQNSESTVKEFTSHVTSPESISTECSTNPFEEVDEINGEYLLGSTHNALDATNPQSSEIKTGFDDETIEESKKSSVVTNFCVVIQEEGAEVNIEQDVLSKEEAVKKSPHITSQDLSDSQQNVCSTSEKSASVHTKPRSSERKQWSKQRKCDYCNSRFISKQSLENHQRTRCGKSESQNSGPGYRVTGRTKLFHNSYPYEIVNGRYHCGSCSLTYKGKKFLEHHIRNVHIGLNNHICNICGARFLQLDQLIQHQHIHEQRERPEVANNFHGENVMSQPEVGRSEEEDTYEEHSYDEEVMQQEVVAVQSQSTPTLYQPELPQCVSEVDINVGNSIGLQTPQAHLDLDFVESSENVEGNQNDKASQADFGPEEEDESTGPGDLYDNVTPYPILFQIEHEPSPEPLEEGVDAFVNSLVAKYYVLEEI